MLSETLAGLGIWGWFVAGVLLMIGELAAPGAYLIWLGLAALATGIAACLLPMGWQAQLLVFALAGLAAAALGRSLAASGRRASDRPFLNRRAEALVGRRFVLTEAIAGGVGHVRVDDTVWRVTGKDCPAGTQIIVTGIDGATLRVRAES